MKKFLKLNENNVIEIILSEDDVKDFYPEENVPDDVVVFYLRINFGYDSVWKIVNENDIYDLKVGFIYFEDLRKCTSYNPPYPSWHLNSELGEWEPPVPYPTDGERYLWNEETISWDLVSIIDTLYSP